ncbi:type I-A CRISPR-associated protein Cas5a [Caldivirga sp.]|uniref:type I-A CRISPR-associated protein Cas5a n=1 Tax=Caldivirga sp. TaxID=2080243 RepID=UPI0025C30A7A|nr:type I-A CRISPR-associated protein Cas5a [Caldivirga sp.]
MSTAGGSYPLPPPSTLIGALYFAHAFRTGEYEEIKEVSGKSCSPVYGWIRDNIVLDATTIPIGKIAITNTLLRLFNWRREIKEEPYTVGYMGLSYINELIAIYAVNDEWFNELKKSAWGIVRLGKKEGLVSVLEVSEVNVESPERLIIHSYLPKSAARISSHNYDVLMFPDLRDDSTYCGGRPKIGEYVFAEEGIEVSDPSPSYKVVKYGNKYALLRWS